MATSLVDIMQEIELVEVLELVQKINQLAKCTLCSEVFRHPKCLPCMDTFCWECIERAAADGTFSCPLCDNISEVPSRSTDLPANFFMEKLLRIRNELGRQQGIDLDEEYLKCDLCIEDNASEKALWRCWTCYQNMCVRCRKVHKLSGITSCHEIFETNSERDKIFRSLNLNFCWVHADRITELYCCDCMALICVECFDKHESHKCVCIRQIPVECLQPSSMLSQQRIIVISGQAFQAKCETVHWKTKNQLFEDYISENEHGELTFQQNDVRKSKHAKGINIDKRLELLTKALFEAGLDEQIDYFTECSVCCKGFTLIRKPVLLPCFHTICLECVTKLAKDMSSARKVKCPTCRYKFCIPQEGVSKIPPNQFIEVLLGLHSAELSIIEGPVDKSVERKAKKKLNKLKKKKVPTATLR